MRSLWPGGQDYVPQKVWYGPEARRVPGRRRTPGRAALERVGDHVDQALERFEVAGGGGLQRLFHEVVARDVDGLTQSIASAAGGSSAMLAPAHRPVVELRRRTARRGRAATPTAPGTSRCSRCACSCSSRSRSSISASVTSPASVSPSLARMPALQYRLKRSGKELRIYVTAATAVVAVVVDERQQRLGQPRQVPRRDVRLVAVRVAPAVVDRAEDRGRVERVHERARPVVDRLARDRHVVGVHHAVDEPDEHPLGDRATPARRHALVEGQVRVRPRPRRDSGGGSSSPRAAGRASGPPFIAAYWNVPTRMWLAATRARTAPGSGRSRITRSPVATTASAREVGMPSACIASPITYSRSIGPTTALPSPPRANGVRPEPFRCRSRRRPAVDDLAEQQRAAVAQARANSTPN